MDITDLRPKVFSTHPETDDAKRQWLHWIKSFATYINKLGKDKCGRQTEFSYQPRRRYRLRTYLGGT